MAALTAASWTVTRTDEWISGKKRWVQGTLLLAGTDTYPTGGIPLPTVGNLGFKRQMDGIQFFGVDATAGGTAEYHTRLDKANHKLLLFSEEATAAGGPLLQALNTEVPGARTWDFLSWGW
jgi:hypothetical protein